MTREEAIKRLKEARTTIQSYQYINEVLDMAIEALEQQAKSKWIPINERLPEDGTWNIFTDGKKISIERYKTDALDHFYPSGRWFSLDEAVAWMPLPERYKESED